MHYFLRATVATIAAALFAMSLSACGGTGGPGGTLPSFRQQQSHAPSGPLASATLARGDAATGNASFTFKIPVAPAKSTARPLFLTSSVKSVSIVTDGALKSKTVANLTSGSPGCRSGSGKIANICVVALSVPYGPHAFTVTTYDGVNSTGNQLATSVTNVNVTAGGVRVGYTLDGSPSRLTLSFGAATFQGYGPSGPTSLIPLLVTVADADGDTIVGNFSVPVTLTTTDRANAALSKTTLASSSDAGNAAVTYSGETKHPITISATASGVPEARISPAFLRPQAATVVANPSIVDAYSVYTITLSNSIPGYTLGYFISGADGSVCAIQNGAQSMVMCSASAAGPCPSGIGESITDGVVQGAIFTLVPQATDCSYQGPQTGGSVEFSDFYGNAQDPYGGNFLDIGF